MLEGVEAVILANDDDVAQEMLRDIIRKGGFFPSGEYTEVDHHQKANIVVLLQNTRGYSTLVLWFKQIL